MDADDNKILQQLAQKEPSMQLQGSKGKGKSTKVDPVAEKKLIEANELLEEEQKRDKALLVNITDKKKQAKTFRQKLAKYNKPAIFVFFGMICALLAGLCAPLFGLLMMKNLSAIMFADACNKAIKIVAETINAGTASD